MQLKSYELKVLVRGKPIAEYAHAGRVFLEGRKGTEFEVEFKNNSSGRVLVIPSVDGLSTLEGTTATPDSKGYVVGPRATLVIPGWTVNDSAVAKFVFADKEKSYATHGESGTTNAGVIGVLVFAEKAKEVKTVYRDRIIPVPVQVPTPNYDPLDPWKHRPRGPWLGVEPWNSTTYGAAGTNTGEAGMNSTISSSVVRGIPRGVTVNDTGMSDTMHHGTETGAPAEESPNGLGTAWGEKLDFQVNQVSFDKGDLQGQMVLFYDTRRNLEKRGIEVVKRERTYLEDVPQAFAGVGCKPPPDWKG
jgi:hypothetical protein